ncbi:MAG: hypothetical protein M1838_003928 [Thelocarpon superellum]|nr:MAG: hypothetical protein M1838_003928 [Thelocarpon superellum]
MLLKSFVLLAAIGQAVAQRPANVSVCDYYTTALLKNNTAENQLELLTLVVNTAVIGNYTKPNVGIAVPGILTPGTYNGTAVNLLQYFDGMLLSTNEGGSSGQSVNFLDDGGAAPLKLNMAANGTTSNQYKLLTHLYQYFGVLLGCTLQGGSAFPPYAAGKSMYQVHKFMALDPFEVGYFITQVGLSAASFGVATEDVTTVGEALGKLFDYRCSPPTTVIPSQGPQLQSICTDKQCPLSPNATCSLESNNGVAVAPANATTNSTTNATTSVSSTGSLTPAPSATTSDGTATRAGSIAVLLAAAMFALNL